MINAFQKRKFLKRLVKNTLIVGLVFLWLLTGWPPVFLNPRFPPAVKEAKASVSVTSAQNNRISNGARVVVRNSSGIPYIIVEDYTDAAIEVWKGNGTTPTAFTEQDTSNNPDATAYGSPSAAIDSSGIIHIVFAEYVSGSSDLEYVQFNTGTDVFQNAATISLDLGAEDTAITNIHTGIAIDANDVPHVVVDSQFKVGGSTTRTVRYNNRIGESWNASMIEVEGATAGISAAYPDLAIDADTRPVITYINGTDGDIGTAVGDSNNPTNFSLYDVETSAYSSFAPYQSIAVDSSGNHHVAFSAGLNGNLYIRKHNYGDGWTTWQTRETVDGGGNGVYNPSLAINGINRYIIVESDSSNDIVYYTDEGGSWASPTTLETGTYNKVKAKWAFWVDNDSGGALVNNDSPVTYYFDGSDATTTDPNNVWTDDTNAIDGSTSTQASTTTAGSITSNYLMAEGTNAPASGNNIRQVRARVYGDGASGSALVVGIRLNGWSDSLASVSHSGFNPAWCYSAYSSL